MPRIATLPHEVVFFNHRLVTAKNRAKPHSIHVTGHDCYKVFLKQKGKCALTGVSLTFEKSGDQQVIIPTNASIDRIDSSKGYTMSNIQIVSTYANRLKSTFSVTELVDLCKMIYRHHQRKVKYEST
jgi:riboflavin synthase alpha subunit